MTDREDDFGGGATGNWRKSDKTSWAPVPKIVSKPVRVTLKKHMPAGPHWAIIVYDTVSTPGYDEGDPPEREDVTWYTAYFTEDEWKAEVSKLATDPSPYGRKEFSAFHVTPASVTVNVSVDVK